MSSPPRRYVRVTKGFLDLPDAVSRGASAREILACLLLSSSTRRIPGVLRAGAGTLAEELGVPVWKVKRALGELAAHGLIAFDEVARTILVRGAIEQDPPANPKVLVAWVVDLHELPVSTVRAEIRATVAACLSDTTRQQWLAQTHDVDTVTHTVNDTVPDTVPHTVSGTVSHTPVPVPVPFPDPVPDPLPLPDPSDHPPVPGGLVRYLEPLERLGAPFNGYAAAAERLSPLKIQLMAGIPLEQWGASLQLLMTSFWVHGAGSCPPTLAKLVGDVEFRRRLLGGEYEHPGATFTCAQCHAAHPILEECAAVCTSCRSRHTANQPCPFDRDRQAYEDFKAEHDAAVFGGVSPT